MHKDRTLRLSIHLVTLVTVVGLCACAPSEPAESDEALPPERPNIVFIMADDLGYADLSSYGRQDYVTPKLDELAMSGMRFTQAYSIAPNCSPTRVGLMTGRYPARSSAGLWEPLSHPARRMRTGLPTDPPTLPLLLKSAGYENGHIGKWHLGWEPEFQPGAHGYDYSFGPLSGSIDYISHAPGTPGGLVPDLTRDMHENGVEVKEGGYATDLFTERAILFLERVQAPFFLSMQYTAPHWPWQKRGDPPFPEDSKDWVADGVSPETFAAMVAALDEGVGKILGTLERLGYADNTLVIFTSDNGGERLSDMGPFRRDKSELWEGGIRVPAIVRWPGRVDSGSTDQVATTLDWTATILSAAGVDPPESYDGMDLIPHLRGDEPTEERTVFWRAYQRHRHKAVRSGPWKYLNIEPLAERDEGVVGEYLFNVVSDQGEVKDLKEEMPERFAELKARYEEWEAEVLEPFPLPEQ